MNAEPTLPSYERRLEVQTCVHSKQSKKKDANAAP